MIRHRLLADGVRDQFTALGLGGDGADGVHQFRSPTVAQGEMQRGAAVCVERGDGGIELLAHKSRQAIQLPDRPQPDVVLIHLRLLCFQVAGEEFHQRLDLRLRTVPILDGKGVQREVPDAQPRGTAQHGAHRLGTATVALDAGQTARGGPAAVAVHDDGDVRREGGPGLFTQFCRCAAHALGQAAATG